MFVTSMSYSVDLHYCKGALMGFSLIGATKSCHEGENSCSRHSGEVMTIDEEDQLVEFSNQDISFFIAYCQIFLEETISYNDVVEYQRYKPPLPDEDILILNQIFLL